MDLPPHLKTTQLTHIITAYLNPKQLLNFFTTHRIHPNTKFTYKTNKSLAINEINYIFHHFPNVTLTGLNINDYDFYNKSLIIPSNKLTHCSTTISTCLHIIQRPTHTLSTFPSITSLHINAPRNIDLDIIHTYPNLQILTSHTNHNLSFYNLPNCKNLHTFKFHSEHNIIHATHITYLSACPNLIHLKLICHINLSYSTFTTLLCPNLRTLKLIDPLESPNHLTLNFLKCPNLRRLTLQSKNSTDISALKFCPKLHTLTLKDCDITTPLSSLKECTKLRHLRLSCWIFNTHYHDTYRTKSSIRDIININ